MELLDRLLSARELAAYLGVPVTTLYAWRYRGEGPPGFRVGRHLRYRWSDVDLWIRGRREDPEHRHLEPWSRRTRRAARRAPTGATEATEKARSCLPTRNDS